MKIDVFYLLNEVDLAEIRLNLYDKYVDKFLIIEATETFSGVPNTPVFNVNDQRWEKFKNKIEHYVISDYPKNKELYDMALSSPNTGNHEHYWVREFYIKEAARIPLSKYPDDAIVFISDCDEFWNFNLQYDPKENEVMKPKQLPYLYLFDQRTSEGWHGWTGTTVCRNSKIKNGVINHIRTDELQDYTIILNGGWHFNAIGGKEKKANACKHPVMSSKEDWNRREVGLRIDRADLPDEILSLRSKYPHYFSNGFTNESPIPYSYIG